MSRNKAQLRSLSCIDSVTHVRLLKSPLPIHLMRRKTQKYLTKSYATHLSNS
ncbi:hypothetical protein T09_9766 [Trichinella sp. T9]|nr:hypothetical protein T09_9766 [Trichinella sp. T9]